MRAVEFINVVYPLMAFEAWPGRSAGELPPRSSEFLAV
jgi:hypothetical protein